MRLGEDGVRGLAPLGREAAERLGADPGAGGEVDDGLQDDDRAAPRISGRRRSSISLRACSSAQPGSMIVAAAEASTSISDLSRLVSSASVVKPKAQKVP